MPVSMSVSVSPLHVCHKFLHHKKGNNSTENPEPNRKNGALVAMGVSMSWPFLKLRFHIPMMRMRFQCMRYEMQEGISQKAP